MTAMSNPIAIPQANADPASRSILFDLHPIYGEFWRSQEKRLLKEVAAAEPGSVGQMAANAFYLAAAHRVRMLSERDTALAMLPWGFYRARANHIARQFRHDQNGEIE